MKFVFIEFEHSLVNTPNHKYKVHSSDRKKISFFLKEWPRLSYAQKIDIF
jgi:hypothetical protein